MAEELLIPKLAKAVEVEFGHILAVEANRKEQTMRNQTDKKDYCIAERLDTVCYHQSTEFCQLCKRNEDDRKRLLQEVGITERSRR